MKILFITERFADDIPTGVISKYIADELNQLGADIYILSSHKVGNTWFNGNHKVCSSKTLVPARLLVYISNLLSKNIITWSWRLRLYINALVILKNFKPDVIYARSTPVAVCEVAAKLGRKTGIKVIMHFTDPVPAPIEWDPNAGYRKRMVSTMNNILPYADLISFGNGAMRDYQQSLLSYNFMSKTFISPDPGPPISPYYDSKEKTPEIKLVHLGAIYGNRNPKPLYDAIEMLNNMGYKCSLDIYDNNRTNEVTPSFVRYVGRTKDIPSALLSADILINLDGDDATPVFISSKLKEYLYCSRPIVSITPDNSPTRQLVGHMSSVTCVSNNKDEIINAIIMYREQEYVSDYYDDRLATIEAFKPKNIAKNIYQQMMKIISHECV